MWGMKMFLQTRPAITQYYKSGSETKRIKEATVSSDPDQMLSNYLLEEILQIGEFRKNIKKQFPDLLKHAF